MDDWVEIGVYARVISHRGSEQIGDAGEPLYVQKHRIRSGQQTITVTVPRNGPTSAGIDPYRLLIELGGTDDNTTTVRAKR